MLNEHTDVPFWVCLSSGSAVSLPISTTTLITKNTLSFLVTYSAWLLADNKWTQDLVSNITDTIELCGERGITLEIEEDVVTLCHIVDGVCELANAPLISALINLSASAFYDRYKTDYYDGNHYSASASASVNVLFLTPYVGIGYDYSEMETKNYLAGYKTDDGVVRYTAGVNFHPLPLVYVYGAYTYTKYNHGFQGGVGINF